VLIPYLLTISIKIINSQRNMFPSDPSKYESQVVYIRNLRFNSYLGSRTLGHMIFIDVV